MECVHSPCLCDLVKLEERISILKKDKTDYEEYHGRERKQDEEDFGMGGLLGP